MAKKASRPAPVKDVAPGANPYKREKSLGRKLGNILGCVCLLVFIIFDELWIGTLAFAIGFVVIYALQVFVEKSYTPLSSPYLYITILVLAMAYAEWRYGILSKLFQM